MKEPGGLTSVPAPRADGESGDGGRAAAGEAASAHLRVTAGTDTHRVLDEARVMLQTRYQVTNVALQVEAELAEGRCPGF